MMWSDYWGALSSRQRTGMAAGAAMIVIVTVAIAVWLMRDQYVTFASQLSSERVNELALELERAKLDYRVAESGDALSVPQSQLGKARAAVAGGEFGGPPSVGLELFKETDFSSTDFAQRINYQRALQGELTRTIETIAGVRKARVHVILPDGGVLKRNVTKASAAVSLAMYPGEHLSRSQVRGVQRLVAASVPEIKLDDVVVLDETGISLTRAGGGEGEGELSSAQLDLKRQADGYLEGKLARLLGELLPDGAVTVSVDTTLDFRQLRVTTEEPIAAVASTNGSHATGVLVRERQSQRGRAAAGLMQTGDYIDDSPSDADGVDAEYEYKVGHRMEQTLSTPGSIERVSVAVALQGAPADLQAPAIEELVAHAVGIDRSRGDSVAVLLLPAARANAAPEIAPQLPIEREDSKPAPKQVPGRGFGGLPSPWHGPIAVLAIGLGALLIALLWRVRQRSRATQEPSVSDAEVEVMTAKVREWLSEGGASGRG
jgi:flagellar M-ring protein FliF